MLQHCNLSRLVLALNKKLIGVYKVPAIHGGSRRKATGRTKKMNTFGNIFLKKLHFSFIQILSFAHVFKKLIFLLIKNIYFMMSC